MSGTGNRRGRNVRWWLALFAWAGWACGLSGAVSVPDRDREAVVPAWGSDFEAAMGRARVSLRPVLVLFTGDNCPACFRLKQGPLTDESVFEVLRQFARVEVDIGRRSELALQYQVRGIPAFRVFEPDGRLRGGFEGYRSAGPLVATLEQILAPAQPGEDPTLLLQRIREGSVEPDDWVATLRLFAVPAARSEVRSAVERRYSGFSYAVASDRDKRKSPKSRISKSCRKVRCAWPKCCEHYSGAASEPSVRCRHKCRRLFMASRDKLN